MATLVTLVQAHAHLRLPFALNSSPVDPRQADLELKLIQAEQTILDYLTGRSIKSSSVADPTVIETYGPHGFTTGNTIVITGHVDSDPDINGSYVLTSVSGTTFTIPIAVTTAGSGGSVSVRASWTDATVPKPVQAAVLLMLTHLWDHRGDDMAADDTLWGAIGRLLARSRDPVIA